MYAVVVRERGQADRINTSGQHVQANVLPRARQAPGIVSGFWMTDMAGATLNVMVFESEDAARSALEPVRTAPRPPSMQVESADVDEVLAHFEGVHPLLNMARAGQFDRRSAASFRSCRADRSKEPRSFGAAVIPRSCPPYSALSQRRRCVDRSGPSTRCSSRG